MICWRSIVPHPRPNLRSVEEENEVRAFDLDGYSVLLEAEPQHPREERADLARHLLVEEDREAAELARSRREFLGAECGRSSYA